MGDRLYTAAEVHEILDRAEALFKEEAARIFVSVVRTVLTNEAKLLDEELSRLEVSVLDREILYDRINIYRVDLETRLGWPEAYDREKAVARALGVLPEITITDPEKAKAKRQATDDLLAKIFASMETKPEPQAAHG